MKHIQKQSEPNEFIRWKSEDKMTQRGHYKWDRLRTNIKQILHDFLIEEQGAICCYCERRIALDNSHIEHFRPQSRFPHKVFDYDNLLCSCQREIREQEPRHCGNSKGNWFDANLLVSPLDPSCIEKFAFSADGGIRPRNKKDRAAETTIEKLKLDIDKLRDMRKKAIEPFIDLELTRDELDKFLKKDGEGKFPQFYTTIKYLFAE